MEKELKKFLISSAIVLLIVIALDFALGKTMNAMMPNTTNRDAIGKTYFSLNEVSTPIVITGSSRAAHHYVTTTIEEKFNLPAFNVAVDGCLFSYNYCVINSILDRYSPEIIIWECDCNSLYEAVEDPFESLYPYYKQNIHATNIIKSENKFSDIFKLNSNLYKYNSIAHKILMMNILKNSFQDKNIKGYSPLKPRINSAMKLEENSERDNLKLSPSKIKFFENTLEKAKNKGIKVIVADSPKYMLLPSDNQSSDMMKELCDKYGMTFINNTQLPQFLEHPEYFNDRTHLNDNGAKAYTDIFVSQIINN